ncbi:MAG: cellulose biosynthesis protein BcsG [Limnobacter sp.]|nr:cellulose biosynthesis protein BcsG [Limnobacter sp.]
MVFWNLYFITKIILAINGTMSLAYGLNIALLILVATKHRTLRVRRFNLFSLLIEVGVLMPAGLFLALHEFGLVVNLTLVQQIVNLTGFSQAYLIELAQRTFEPEMLWAGLFGLIVLRIFNRYIRLTAWTLVLLIGTATATSIREYQADQLANSARAVSPDESLIRSGSFAAERLALSPDEFARLKEVRDREAQSKDEAKGGPDDILRKFYEDQRLKIIDGFLSPKAAPDFDVIVLHVCSMAWADIQASKLSAHPVLTQADLVLKQFNTVSSYSGPATLRFLRSNCGQGLQKDLYSPLNAQCGLYNSLRLSGFRVQMGMNHDGAFDQYRTSVLKNLPDGVEDAISHKSVPLGAKAFDGSQLARDEDYLNTWWAARLRKPEVPVAYYYNTISLHDGNSLPGSSTGSLASYPIRLERLLDDFQAFIQTLKKSERKVLLMIVPEHGAGLTGEYGQLPGLREIPSPAITLAPVLGYWIDPEYTRNPEYSYPIVVKQPTSYLAVSEFISRWLKLPTPARSKPAWPLIVGDLPTTPFVAEEGEIMVLEQQNQYWIKAPGASWEPLTNTNKASQ